MTKGENITLTADYAFKGSCKKLACSYATLATSVTPGQSILVADGSLVLTVLSCHPAEGEVICRIENDCSIGERKNMNLPGVIVDLPTLTEKDIDDIQNWGVKNDVDYVAASFVRKASDVHKLREVLGESGSKIKIYCKIENQEGMENYGEILNATDGISKYSSAARSELCIVYLLSISYRQWLPEEILVWRSLLKRFSLPRR